MPFICDDCKDKKHDVCIEKNGQTSTWCDCLHRTGRCG